MARPWCEVLTSPQRLRADGALERELGLLILAIGLVLGQPDRTNGLLYRVSDVGLGCVRAIHVHLQ